MKYLFMFLMLCGLAFGGSYTYYLGGASANDSNPYFHETAVGTAALGTNGAALWTGDDAASGACADNGGKTQITITGTLPAITAGTYAYIDFAPASYTDGYYRVNSRDGDTTFTIECTYIDTSDVDAIRIGGCKTASLTNLDAVFAETTDYNIADGTATVLPWASHKIDVRIVGSSISLGGTWDIGGTANRVGTAAAGWVDVWACDTSYAFDADAVTFIPSADLSAVAMIYLANGSATNYYITLHGFVCDGTDGANTAKYGFATNAAANASFFTVDRMICHSMAGAASAGFYARAVTTSTVFSQCSSYSNAGDGFLSGGTSSPTNYFFCVAYSNGDSGFELTGSNRLVNCISHSNTGDGVKSSATGDNSIVANCLFANNGGDGLDYSTAQTYDVIFVNNVSYNNTTYGYVFGDLFATNLFTGNCAYKNHGEAAAAADQLYDGTTSYGGAAFIAYDAGSNIASNPLFVDPDNDDYTLQSASPLIGTGTNCKTIGPTSRTTGGGFVNSGVCGGFDQ